jgi:hypothetical protein
LQPRWLLHVDRVGDFSDLRVFARRSDMPVRIPTSPVRLVIGDLVEVHTRYNDSWCTGFEIAEVLPGGYRVRRTHDQMVLPDETSDHDVRPAQGVQPWS